LARYENSSLCLIVHRHQIQGAGTEPGKFAPAPGGFVSGVDFFEPSGIWYQPEGSTIPRPISPTHTRSRSPGTRFLLLPHIARLTSHISQALVDSGIDYRGSNTGVYLGQLLVSTDEVSDDWYGVNDHTGVGKCIALRANRVSFTFDLKGPSFLLDTGEWWSFRPIPSLF